MVMQRRGPFDEFGRIEDWMRRLAQGSGMHRAEHEVEDWAVPLDVIDEGNSIVVHATLPGVRPENIDVTLDNDVLTIKGETKAEQEVQQGTYLMRERRTGRFHRSLRLPDVVDTDRAESRYDNGVLTITFPKQEVRRARRLDIRHG